VSQQIKTKLNRLISSWPPNAIYAASWLNAQGYGYDLINKYRLSGWLKAIGRGAVARAGDEIKWTGGLYAVQTQLKLPVHIGGKSALLLKGYAHFVPQGKGWELYLFGEPKTKLPTWFKDYPWEVRPRLVCSSLFLNDSTLGLVMHSVGAFSVQISSPERAMLEHLSLVPQEESIQEAKLLMEGLTTLRPKLVQKLLEACNSVKVKRLFLFFGGGVPSCLVQEAQS
jgi:hypothetical protein